MRAIVAVADGSNETEAITVLDVLRRAGVEVVCAKVGGDGLEVEMARGVRVLADKHLDDSLADMIVLPGGLKGAENFA